MRKDRLLSSQLIRQATIFAHQMDGNLGGTFSKLSAGSKNELLWMAQEIADNLEDVDLPRSNFEAYVRAYLKIKKNEKL
jgi:hypothetical protein